MVIKMNSSYPKRLMPLIIAAIMLISIIPVSSASSAHQNGIAFNLSSTNTAGSFQNITSQIEGLPSIPGAWASLTVSGDGGFISVGGNGVVFYNGSVSTPKNNTIPQAGYITGAAYRSNCFLLVGTRYLPNPAPLMYKFYPSNDTIVNVSSVFPSNSIGHEILYQDVYYNGLFYISASSKVTGLNQSIPYTILCTYNPNNGSISNITPTVFNKANPHVSNIEEYISPLGIFMLATANNYIGDTYLYLYNATSSSALRNLSYLLPQNFSVHTPFLPGMNMIWYKGNLIVGGSQAGMLSMFAVNLSSDSIVNFPKISSYIGTINSLTVGNGSLFIGGLSCYFIGNGLTNNPLLLMLPDLNASMFRNPIVDMSSVIPLNFHMISSMAYSNGLLFITGGEMYYADFGIVNFNNFKYNIVTFYTSNSEAQVPFQITINSHTYQSYNNTVDVGLADGNYTYTASPLNNSYEAYEGAFSVYGSLPIGIDVKFVPNSSTSSSLLPYVVGSQALNYKSYLALNFSASLYLYGYSTGGTTQASQFTNGSYLSGVGENGYTDTGMAITTSSVNSYNPGGTLHYTIGGVAVNDFTAYRTYKKVNTPPVQPATTINLTFNVTSYSLVVFMGMSGGAFDISLHGISGLKIDSILNYSGAVGLEIAQAYLNPGTYTVMEYSTNGDGGSNTRSEILTASVFTGANSIVNEFGVKSSKSFTLPNGSKEYFFAGSTAGIPITSESWDSDFQMNVNQNTMGLNGTVLTIGHQKSNIGSYTSNATNYQISGVGVSGFTNYSVYDASVRSFNYSQSFQLGFRVNSTALVLIMIAGGGVGSINITGGSQLFTMLYDSTFSEGGAQVNASAAAYEGNLQPGIYNVTINSTMNAVTNSGSGGVVGAVAYVFYPGSSEYSQLYLNISPSNSQVYVNSKIVSLSSNGKASLSLLPGNYYVNATLSGYHSFSNMFTIGPDRAYFVNVTLTPLLKYGYLIGSVAPGNATLSIGGIIIPVHDGRYNESISPGTYFVSATDFGYLSQFTMVNITENGVTYLNISLIKSSTSYILSGQVNPSYASVVVGEYIAYVNSSGFYKISLPSGTYMISATAKGYYSQTRNITLNQNMENVNFVLNPEPSPTSTRSISNVTANGYNVTISNLAMGNGTISVTYTASVNGTLSIVIPYSEIRNVTVNELLSSRIYINGTQYKNYTVAISSINGTYNVILTVDNLSGDPTLYWLYSPSATVPISHNSTPTGSQTIPPYLQEFGLIALAIVIAASVITITMRKKK